MDALTQRGAGEHVATSSKRGLGAVKQPANSTARAVVAAGRIGARDPRTGLLAPLKGDGQIGDGMVSVDRVLVKGDEARLVVSPSCSAIHQHWFGSRAGGPPRTFHLGRHSLHAIPPAANWWEQLLVFA